MKKLIPIIISLTCTQLHALDEGDYRTIFTAIAKQESSLNSTALNKREDARGIIQIRALYLKDANAFLKTAYKHSQCYSLSISYKLFKAYMKRYKARTFAECAKLHNGGPYWRKKPTAVNIYWNKVRKNL